MSGFTSEAEGYAASLRQQAAWIEESPAAEMIDADELRDAANFIERQQGIIAPAQSAPVSLYELDDESYARFVEALGGNKSPTQALIDLMRGYEKVKANAAALRAPEAANACAKCGYPRKEHSYNGACYGLCGEFVAPEEADAGAVYPAHDGRTYEEIRDGKPAASPTDVRMQEALLKISQIKNKDFGPDWEEIEEARAIALAALSLPATDGGAS